MSSADGGSAQPGRSTKRARRLVAYLTLSFVALVSLLPLAWMLSTSLKSRDEVFAYPPQWIPEVLRWDNYSSLWADFPYFNLWILNSFKIVGLIVIGQLIVCSMSAYAFARLNFPGRDLIFYLYLGSMLVPDMVNIIPTYVIFSKIGWIDTHQALIVPGLASAIGIFMLRQFFLTIPHELEDAARVDGAGYWRIYRDIIIPLSGPALATLAVFLFIWNWSDFFSPLVLMNSPPNFTITLGMAYLNDARSTDWERLMAGNVISLIPLILVYMLAQKRIVEGIATTGLKG
ncbi:MAG: carbohydrate ABC transporter permease [Actinobacteria bacterium]|nr:carbohydrate ABC transporter permease [Actinomycetota bacterium]